MGVSLSKGGNVSLTKANNDAAAAAGTTPSALTDVFIGLGWDARTTDGAKFDLDSSAIPCGADGKVVSDKHFVFYGNKKSVDGSVEHGGDNLTGEGEGDDEVIKVKLDTVPADVDKIVFPVSIYEAEKNGQSFGQVRNAYIRVVNASDNTELARYDLTEDASTETAMVFGELYRNGAEWKFRAIGAGYASGLAGIATEYGVNI
jgi:tellurium resistance protein TerD